MSHSSSSTSSHGSVKSYVTGLLLSLVLTVIPFAVVMSGALSTATT
ncbi:MAG: cytochrome o ubiquinol oxidase subunit IV, partial [Pseudomonadota bacterium]|nr:cytochrome o ubiquinol oxidase subunit IV [Pseudomonadota bacterium]